MTTTARRTAADVRDQLPKAVSFLLLENDYQPTSWPKMVEAYEDLFRDADVYRKAGDPVFDKALTEIFEDAQRLLEVHKRYCAKVKGPYRFTTMRTPRLTFPTRLAPYPRDLPDPCCNEEPRPPPTYTSLIPRPDEVMDPPFAHGLMSFKGGLDWRYFFKRPESMEMHEDYIKFGYHAALWAKEPNISVKRWKKVHPWMVRLSNKEGINIAQYENIVYEKFMAQELPALVKFGRDLEAGRGPGFNDDKRISVERGFKRALIQKVLSIMNNQENKDINTAWRRVVFPKKPEKFKDIHFSGIALPKREKFDPDTGKFEVDRHKEYEPSPWVYWYNQWHNQAEYLSAWSRKQYNQKYWKDLKRTHLPVNYRGPYTFDDKCVWDKHWLTVGKKLVALRAVLERLAQTNTRPILRTCLEDINAGVAGDPISYEVIPRPDIDLCIGKNDKYQLLDEVDMSWMKIFCLPGTSRTLSGLTKDQPEDPLVIILDHRLQNLMTDVHNNPFWVTDHKKGDDKPTYRARQIALEHLLPMINLGGKDVATRTWEKDLVTVFNTPPNFKPNGSEIPNALYQFNLKELKVYCSQLAEMGRIAYKRPEDPKEFQKSRWWSGKGMLYGYPDPKFASAGGFIVPVPPGIDKSSNFGLETNTDSMLNPMRYAEERILWRYPNQAALEAENKRDRDEYAAQMVKRNRAATTTTQLTEAQWKDEFNPVRHWKQDYDFPATSIHARRQCPAWEDLCDYRTVMNKDTGFSTKTIQFLRNLAYRMGRTIRLYNDLVVRTSKVSGLKRNHCNTALKEWKKHTEKLWNDPASITRAYIPLKLALPNEVIKNVDDAHPEKDSKNATEVFRAIREGIIEDLVQDRVMLYPSRRTVYTDKSSVLFEMFDRANIWSFGAEAVRERQAPYRRKRYFDMQRWPVNKQTKETTKKKITERLDEDPSIQPVSSFWKYGIKVGPTEMVPVNSDVVTRLVNLITDPDKAKVAGQLVQYLSKEIVKIIESTDNFGPGWQIHVAPPGTKIQASGKDSGAIMPGAAFKPIVRIKQQFIPGPAVFPMGDTLLQQIKISQELEKILDPTYQKGNRLGDIIGHMADWITPPPKRISLLPDMDLTKIPSSEALGLKRKVPTAFMASDGRVPKRQIVHGSSGPRAATIEDSDSDDVEEEWDDADKILPPQLRSGGNEIARTTRKSNGTFKISLNPDIEDIMRLRAGVLGRRSLSSFVGGRGSSSWNRARTTAHTAPRHPTGGPRAPLTAAARARLSEAKANFDAIFPRGFSVLATSGNRLLCALYAIVGSMKAQYPAQTPPTVNELYDHFLNPRDPVIKAAHTATSLTNQNELSSDQAASTLLDWSLSRGRVYQLGLYAPVTDTPHMLLGIPASHGAPSGTVWIQSNADQAGIDALIEAEQLAIAKKGSALTVAEIEAIWPSAGASNHFSSLRPN